MSLVTCTCNTLVTLWSYHIDYLFIIVFLVLKLEVQMYRCTYNTSCYVAIAAEKGFKGNVFDISKSTKVKVDHLSKVQAKFRISAFIFLDFQIEK